jgi:iron complex transport system ATP-binding protein
MSDFFSVQDAAFSYEEMDIFSGLNFDVRKGELLCLMGANGCGKTTLLRCMNGILKLKKGKVLLGGQDINTMTEADVAKKMGFVFQDNTAPFPYPVIDIVSMGRAPYLGTFSTPSSADIKIAEEALEMVGMLALKDRPFTRISGGQRQLVAIARAITQQSEIILLDEPTSHLDFKNQTLVLRIANQLVQKGFSVVMSSHLPDHALLYSNRVALMKDGKFIAVGSPDKVITEENLKETYEIDVRILSANDPVSGEEIRFCIPAKAKAAFKPKRNVMDVMS